MAKKRKPRRKPACFEVVQRKRLSICMIVRDEEKALPGCLESIRGLADELIVVDTGSTDCTVQIARAHGAKISHFEWVDDFSAARNASIRVATGDWILWVDADDRIDEKYHPIIHRLMEQPPDRAFAFVLENTGGDTATCIQVRMFPNVPGVQFSTPVHEQITPSLMKLGITKIARTEVVVTHTGYTDAEAIQRKKERYLGIMEKWLEQHPEDYVTRSHVALTYHTIGRPAEAIRGYTRIVADSSCQQENPYLYRYALLFLGRAHMQSGDHAQALETLHRAREAGTERTLVELSLGECYHYLGEREKAVEHLSYACQHPMQRTYFPIDLDTIHYAAYHFLGEDLQALGRFEEAAIAYEMAVQILPTKADAWLSLARLYQEQGAWESMQGVLVCGQQCGARYPELDHLLGTALLQQNRLGEARSAFEKALELEPAHQGAGNNLGLVLAMLGDLDAAREIYRRVLEAHPDAFDTLTNLAHLHLKLEEYVEAQRCFQRALAVGVEALDVLLGYAWASAELGEDELTSELQDRVQIAMPSVSFMADGMSLSARFRALAQSLAAQGRTQIAHYAEQTADTLDASSMSSVEIPGNFRPVAFGLTQPGADHQHVRLVSGA